MWKQWCHWSFPLQVSKARKDITDVSWILFSFVFCFPAREATRGGFQKLENLNISINHKITEEGYRNFFQALDNLPNLQELNISRHISECIQVQATTVKALGQCVSRLPSLTRLHMLSWLLDEEDMKVINDVKERHPQSKRLIIFWKLVVPFSPVVLE